MESIARSYLDKGDVVAAAKLLTSLEMSQPRVAVLAKRCRVLADPLTVPVPHRYTDVADAILDASLPLEAYFGTMGSEEETLRRFNKLLLLVHPDKNPCKQASEAFVRLRTLKDKALRHVADKKVVQEKNAEESAKYELLRATPPPPQQLPAVKRHPSEKSKRSSSTAHPPKSAVSLTSRPVPTELLPVVDSLPPRDSLLSTRSLGGGGSKGQLRVGRDRPQAPLWSAEPVALRNPVVEGRRASQDTVLDSMRSELLKRKDISLKLTCTFEGSAPSPVPEGDSDAGSDEETLCCTVRSTLSYSSGGNHSSQLLTDPPQMQQESVSTFSFRSRGSSENPVMTDSIIQQGMATHFSANALASMQAAWAGYRQRKQNPDNDDDVLER